MQSFPDHLIGVNSLHFDTYGKNIRELLNGLKNNSKNQEEEEEMEFIPPEIVFNHGIMAKSRFLIEYTEPDYSMMMDDKRRIINIDESSAEEETTIIEEKEKEREIIMIEEDEFECFVIGYMPGNNMIIDVDDPQIIHRKNKKNIILCM